MLLLSTQTFTAASAAFLFVNKNISSSIWSFIYRSSIFSVPLEDAGSPKQCKLGPRLLLITNRKSHTRRFRLVPKTMILDDLNDLYALYCIICVSYSYWAQNTMKIDAYCLRQYVIYSVWYSICFAKNKKTGRYYMHRYHLKHLTSIAYYDIILVRLCQ